MLYEAAELDAAALRHASFYKSKLDALRGEYDETPRRAVLNLRKALPQIQRAHSWLYGMVQRGHPYDDLLTDMTAASIGHLRMVISPDEWHCWLEQGTEAAVLAGRVLAQLEFRLEQGTQAFRQGDLAQASDIAAASLALARQQGSPAHTAQLYYLRALIYQKQGDPGAALDAVQQAQHHYEAANDVNGIGKVRSFIAQASIDAGEYDRARTLLQENIALWEANGNLHQMAVEQYQLGVMLSNRLLFDEADTYLQQANETFQQLADRRYQAYSLQILCSNQMERAAYDAAMAHIEEAHALFAEVNDQRGMSGCLNYIGRIYHHQGDFPNALDAHQQAAQVAQAINYRFALADAHRSMCEICLKQGDVAAARTQAHRALVVSRASSSKLLVLAVLSAAVGVLRADHRSLLAAQVAQAIRSATQEPIILDFLEPYLDGLPEPSGTPMTVDDAVKTIKNLYN